MRRNPPKLIEVIDTEIHYNGSNARSFLTALATVDILGTGTRIETLSISFPFEVRDGYLKSVAVDEHGLLLATVLNVDELAKGSVKESPRTDVIVETLSGELIDIYTKRWEVKRAAQLKAFEELRELEDELDMKY